ncbi:MULTISPECIES: hypothetical protein [unclassified Streptomyces]|uniref:hypothetical protein n=1 Tax=unclassified Streptomyces TaxID=2593676 RepID=UPI0037FB8692
MALSAVREDERDGYMQRLEAFAEQHSERFQELLCAYGPGSAPAEHGRYALVGQPESLITANGWRAPRSSCAAGGRARWKTSCWTTSSSRGDRATA